ncbi:hypothetical protein [Pedobacter sp. ASV28]|uniref:hypothetical protein n=1 Tax=Pedobacter sp. ASV28 TaxID=2795123 RepID=UPI0018EBBD73|nr:hypothetical protein [Pedobacter sp. ASV28]
MKKTITICFLILLGLGSYAQNFDEWFRQNKTQKKYLIEQIAALKVYGDYVKAGYKIVNGGLDLIGDLKGGEFNLHKKYFNDLVTVSPQIKKYSKIAETISRQIELVKLSHDAMRTLRQSGMMKEEELLYLKRVFDRVIDHAAILLDELAMLIGDGQVSLKDDERIERIDNLNEETRKLHLFLTGFTSEAKQLANSRYRETLEIKRMRNYFGIIED